MTNSGRGKLEIGVATGRVLPGGVLSTVINRQTGLYKMLEPTGKRSSLATSRRKPDVDAAMHVGLAPRRWQKMRRAMHEFVGRRIFGH
jgi:hypothetical protein